MTHLFASSLGSETVEKARGKLLPRQAIHKTSAIAIIKSTANEYLVSVYRVAGLTVTSLVTLRCAL